VRRKDHWVRWVEWLAAVAFWWNPITWWSQRNLRASEELACDALVLTTFQPERQRYASSLLGVTEFLSTEGVRPPRVATPMSRGGELETRITMIIPDRLPRTPRWVVSAALALGAAFLPLSVAYAQDYAAIERRLAAAVEAGEITKAQAEAMMGALARTAAEKSKPAEADMRAKRMRYARFEKGIKARVEKGAMSPEEAEARLRETREKMFGGEAAGKRDVDPRAMRERYAQLEERIAAAVESGRMTREQGAERLAQAKERMMEATRAKGAGEGQADMRARRMRYAEYEKGIKARVEKGAMSPEEAEAKLRATREKMFGGDKTRKAGPKAGKKGASREKKADDSARGKKVDETSMKALYAEYEKRLDDAVAKGEMTAEQAKAKLAEARRKMFGE
jgi:polyhydroxyalkanoate synthesis regulator phasin